MEQWKREKNYANDTDFFVDELKFLCDLFKEKVHAVLGTPFPDDPNEQPWGAIGAVFKSWYGKQAAS